METTQSFNMWPWLAIVAAAALAYALRYRYKKTRAAAVCGRSDADTAPVATGKAPAPAGPEAFIFPILKYFAGSLNALHALCAEPDHILAVSTFENISRIFDSRGSEDAKIWFSSFQKDRKDWDDALYGIKANEMIQILKNCGLTVAPPESDIWSDSLLDRYTRLIPIAEGARFSVAAPCWLLDGKVFEKGIVTPYTA